MNSRFKAKRIAQLIVVLLGAFALKQYYSTTSVNQLRWILAPTTFLVELITGLRFAFESHAGYMSSDRTFVIAASCAGVNFLITAFLMLSLRKLWQDRSRDSSWIFIPAAAVIAYVSTLAANTFRISTALSLRQMPSRIDWLSANQLHRFEGIFIYFGFLLLLFLLTEKIGKKAPDDSKPRSLSRMARQAFFPLVIYYATTLGIPLINGVFRRGINASDFWEHSAFVLVIPMMLVGPIVVFRLQKHWRQERLKASV